MAAVVSFLYELSHEHFLNNPFALVLVVLSYFPLRMNERWVQRCDRQEKEENEITSESNKNERNWVQDTRQQAQTGDFIADKSSSARHIWFLHERSNEWKIIEDVMKPANQRSQMKRHVPELVPRTISMKQQQLSLSQMISCYIAAARDSTWYQDWSCNRNLHTISLHHSLEGIRSKLKPGTKEIKPGNISIVAAMDFIHFHCCFIQTSVSSWARGNHARWLMED